MYDYFEIFLLMLLSSFYICFCVIDLLLYFCHLYLTDR